MSSIFLLSLHDFAAKERDELHHFYVVLKMCYLWWLRYCLYTDTGFGVAT
jgi:hypothetical protein